ncbi:MAG: hypothetical protein EXR62_03475 [Chloroflexi bacterium]|nr:hypothetical protein [Chloroflexota bacterium]
MGRVIAIEKTANTRNQLRRTIAETLNRLMAKRSLDDEVKDLAALIVFCLREILEGVDQSATAWEKRNYFLKADRFRMEWEWAAKAAADLERVVREERWQDLPPMLARLAPRFTDITINKLMRSSETWEGCYQRLKAG